MGPTMIIRGFLSTVRKITRQFIKEIVVYIATVISMIQKNVVEKKDKAIRTGRVTTKMLGTKYCK